MKLYFSLFILFLFYACEPISEKQWPELKVMNKIPLSIPEPSDICFAPGQQSFYIVSDRGALFQTDLEGHILQQVNKYGNDYEAVWYQAPYIHVVDETRMQITLFDPKTFKDVAFHKYDIPVKSNKGWESITYHPVHKSFVLFTEKKPVKLFEINEEYLITREEETEEFVEVSACTWFNNSLWVLSDEKQEVYQVNPESYKVEKAWSIPVKQPEGICFSDDGKMYIVCDRRSVIYVFAVGK